MLLLSIRAAGYPIAFIFSAFSDIGIGHQVVFLVKKHPAMLLSSLSAAADSAKCLLIRK